MLKRPRRLRRKLQKNLRRQSKSKTPAQKIRDYFKGKKWVNLTEQQEKNLKKLLEN